MIISLLGLIWWSLNGFVRIRSFRIKISYKSIDSRECINPKRPTVCASPCISYTDDCNQLGMLCLWSGWERLWCRTIGPHLQGSFEIVLTWRTPKESSDVWGVASGIGLDVDSRCVHVFCVKQADRHLACQGHLFKSPAHTHGARHHGNRSYSMYSYLSISSSSCLRVYKLLTL